MSPLNQIWIYIDCESMHALYMHYGFCTTPTIGLIFFHGCLLLQLEFTQDILIDATSLEHPLLARVEQSLGAPQISQITQKGTRPFKVGTCVHQHVVTRKHARCT